MNIQRTIYGVTVELEFDYTPGRPGTMYNRNGDPGDPPEPDEVTINEIKIGGEDMTDHVSESFYSRCEEVCYEAGYEIHNERWIPD